MKASSDYFLFCHCIIYTSPKSAVLLVDQEISCADLRFLYYIPAERRSAGTLVLLVIIDRNTLKKSTRHLTLTPITTLTTLTPTPLFIC